MYETAGAFDLVPPSYCHEGNQNQVHYLWHTSHRMRKLLTFHHLTAVDK